MPGAGCGSRARRDTVASCISCSVSPAHYHVSESWPVVRAGHRRGAREGSTLRAKRGAWLPTAPAASRSRFARRLGGSSDLLFGVEPTTLSGSSRRRNYERHRRMSTAKNSGSRSSTSSTTASWASWPPSPSARSSTTASSSSSGLMVRPRRARSTSRSWCGPSHPWRLPPTEGCSLLRGRLTIEYASVLQAASRFLYILFIYLFI